MEPGVKLPARTRVGLFVQREVGRLLSVVWIPGSAFILSVIMRYRIQNAAELRRRFRTLVRETDKPVLICPNHLTMADSALVTWALGGSWWYLFNYRWVPWNLPEYNNFASLWINRVAAWVTKCLPVVRGGRRQDVSAVLKRVQHLITRGETAIIFAEGGRSRTGRIQLDSIAHGMGRIVNAVPDCHALCVYLRGERQATWSTIPARGDSFYVDFEMFRPESEHRGLRRSRDFARQIGERLVALEKKYRTFLASSGQGSAGDEAATGSSSPESARGLPRSRVQRGNLLDPERHHGIQTGSPLSGDDASHQGDNREYHRDRRQGKRVGGAGSDQ